MNKTLLSLFSGSLLCLTGVLSAQNGMYNATFTDMGVPPSGAVDWQYSGDQSQIAIILRDDLSNWVWYKKQISPKYDGVGRGCLFLNKDGSHIVYAVDNALQSCLVTDGVEGPKFDNIFMESVAMSPDGKHVSFSARKGNQWFLVMDGKQSQPYDSAPPLKVAYAPDGAHWASAGVRNGDFLLIRDGRDTFAYDSVDILIFSNQGNHFAYAARMGNRSFFSVDDKLQTPYDYVFAPVFSKDGEHFAYIAVDAGKAFVVADGKPGATYERILPPVYSGNGKHLAYPVFKNGKWRIVTDDKESAEEYDMVGIPVMSDDGALTCFQAKIGEQTHLVVNGGNGPDFLDVALPIVSANGKMAGAIVQSADKKWAVAVNGNTSPEFDQVMGLTISPDGQHFAFAARLRDDWMIFVDMKAGPILTGVCPPGPTFDEAGNLTAFVFLNGKLQRLSLKP